MAKEDSAMEEENQAGDGEIAIISETRSVWMSIWVWEAVLAFITRMEMAERVSLVCLGLKKLCWPRLHGKKVVAPHWVEELSFGFGEDDEENGQTKATLSIYGEHNRAKMYPIATVAPPPDYILGFKNISIYYLNWEVLAFMRNIRPLLAGMHLMASGNCKFRFRSFLEALNGCPIACLDMGNLNSMWELRQRFPGLLANVPAISHKDCVEMSELIVAKIGNGKSFAINIQCCKEGSIPIQHIQKNFQSATQQQSFFIGFGFFFEIGWEPLKVFRLENEQTGEVLALEQNGYSSYELYRCPRGEVQHWREEAEKLLSPSHYSCRVILY